MIKYPFKGAWFAIVDGVQVTRAVLVFTVLTVAATGPKGTRPTPTFGNASAGPVPVVFVAVKVNSYSVPAVNPVTV
jgi:hypothetical protein